MMTSLIITSILMSCKTLIEGFANARMHAFLSTKLNGRLSSFCDGYDDDGNEKRKKIYNFNYEDAFNHERGPIKEQNDNILDNSGALYTLIWFDCEDCKKLFRDVHEGIRKNICYIDGGYYFFDEDDESSSPLFYKNDLLIATDLFSVYEELFFKQINGEKHE